MHKSTGEMDGLVAAAHWASWGGCLRAQQGLSKSSEQLAGKEADITSCHSAEACEL
jgi:hypothetical protein